MTREDEIKIYALQLMVIHSVITILNNDDSAEDAVNRLLPDRVGEYPFDIIRFFIKDGDLGAYIKTARVTNSTEIEKALTGLVTSEINLMTCTVDELGAVDGINPKIAVNFILKLNSKVFADS